MSSYPDLLSQDTELIIGLIGASSGLLGTIIGSLLSYWLTERSINRNNKRNEKELYESAITSIVQKLDLIRAYSVNLKRHIENGYLDAAIHAIPHPSDAIMPFSPYKTVIDIGFDEVSYTRKNLGLDGIGKILGVFSKFSILVDTSTMYSDKKIETQQMVTPTSVSGSIGHINLTQAQYLSLYPRYCLLDSLAFEMYCAVEDIVNDAVSIMIKLFEDEFLKNSDFHIEIECADGSKICLGSSLITQ